MGMQCVRSFPVDKSILPGPQLLPHRNLLFTRDDGTSVRKARLRPNVFLKPPSPLGGLLCFSLSSLLFSPSTSIHPPPTISEHHLGHHRKPNNQHVYWTSLILDFFESCLIDSLIFPSSLSTGIACSLAALFTLALFFGDHLFASSNSIDPLLSPSLRLLGSSVKPPVLQHASPHFPDSRRSPCQPADLGPTSAQRQILWFVPSSPALVCHFCRITDTQTRHWK